jgi:hypothetical protein
MFCGHLVYFVVIWYISPILVSCTKKNLATLTVTANCLDALLILVAQHSESELKRSDHLILPCD